MEKEIELLENVELRFALAETDAQLEKTLTIFLSPVLIKLGSPHEAVRSKVMNVLSHINKRIRSKTNIKLPLTPLIDLVCTENVTKSPFVKNFAIMYLEMAYERLTEEDQITHLPSLIENISLKPSAQKQTLIHIILSVLQKFKPKPANSPSALDPYNFKSHPNDAKFLLKFINSSMIFPDSLPENIQFAKFLILLVATCDSSHEVVGGGEDGLRKLKPPNLENKEVVDGLYFLHQGSNPSSETFREPASPTLKFKIMNYLCKSQLATNTFPAMLQVSFDCLYGMSFVQWIARMADASKIRPITQVLLSGLLKYINEAISLLAQKVPEVFHKDLSILSRFFSALSLENENIRISVQEALSNMIEVYKLDMINNNPENIKIIESILEENIDKV
ncbi:6468_t:CDS:10 [Diversispora eburnea]|uniref:6468_t:CDS:1 n=1 Tax=Diversispora eburnea TaxID=1213867 RepID=A0A9N9B458_9GLOM|nr:6468_t:CDS:10 [Diversispora eburnea]